MAVLAWCEDNFLTFPLLRTQTAVANVFGRLYQESGYESAGISKKDLPQLQNRATQTRVIRHLYGKETQAKTGLIRENR